MCLQFLISKENIVTKAKGSSKKGSAVELSEEGLSRVHGGIGSSREQKIVVKRDTAPDASTSADDVIVEGKFITASNIC